MTDLTATNAIYTKDLSISYRDELVVDNVEVYVKNGSMTAIIGPNGAGKTTMLKGMLGLIPLVSGTTVFYGQASLAQVRKQIAYVPQKSMVNWDFPTTVRDVAVMGRYVHLGWIKRPSKEDYRLADQALELVGMSSFYNRQISELSGGQKQRVFIARALTQQPELLILDEPLQGVDIKTEQTIIATLKELQAQGKTILAVHHNLNNVADIFDEAILINKQLISVGKVREVMTDANLKAAYTNSIFVNE